MAKLAVMKTSSGNWRIRRYENENDNITGNFTEEYNITAAQWLTLLNVVGVNGSVAAGTANTEAATPAAIQAGKLSPVAYS